MPVLCVVVCLAPIQPLYEFVYYRRPYPRSSAGLPPVPGGQDAEVFPLHPQLQVDWGVAGGLVDLVIIVLDDHLHGRAPAALFLWSGWPGS